MKATLSITLLAAVLVTSIGCSKTYPPPDTPQQAVENMTQALLDDDLKGYMACFEGATAELMAAKATFRFMRACIKFREKMIKEHGQEAWDAFQSVQGGGVTLKLPVPYSAKAYPIWPRGKTAAVCQLPYRTVAVRLTRTDDLWLVQAKGYTMQGFSALRSTALVINMTSIINDATRQLGRDKMTPAEIDEAMGAAFFYALLNG